MCLFASIVFLFSLCVAVMLINQRWNRLYLTVVQHRSAPLPICSLSLFNTLGLWWCRCSVSIHCLHQVCMEWNCSSDWAHRAGIEQRSGGVTDTNTGGKAHVQTVYVCLCECQQRQYEDAGILKLRRVKTSSIENVPKGFSKNEGEIR